MRVLYLDTALKIAGGQKSLVEIVNSMDTVQVTPVVACPPEALLRGLLRPEIPVLPLNSFSLTQGARAAKPTDPLLDVLRLIPQTRRFHIDLIHANTYFGAIVGSGLSLATRIPLIFHVRGLESHGLWDRLVYSVPKFIVVPSKSSLDVIPPRHHAKTRLIYNAIQMEQVEASASPPFQVEREDGEIVIGCVARLSPIKGQDILLRSLARLPGDLKIHVLLIGAMYRPEDEEYVAALHKLQQDLLDVPNRALKIDFVPHQQDILAVMKQLDILVVPSRDEPFGRSVVEGMAAGIPVVASRVGGIPEIITDGETGLLFDVNSEEALSNHLDSLCRSSDFRHQLGQAGRANYLNRFTVQRLVGELRQLYEEILE